MKKTIFIVGTIIVLIVTLLYPNAKVLGETNSDSTINISISPKDYLFDIKNMKPGDWAPRNIVIKNSGLSEFVYNTTVQFDDGSEKLFNELLLEISDGNGELYKGKLADFEELSPRSLEPSSKEELTFTIRFPERLGNDFQGLSTKFLLSFYAEGDGNDTDEVISGGIIGGDGTHSSGGILPDTATNMFTFLFIGLALLMTGLIFYLLQRIRKLDKRRV